MWRALSSSKDESDDEFIVWRVRAESDDGRIQIVDVKVDAQSGAMEESPTGGNMPSEVRVAIVTQGRSLIGRFQDFEDLPTTFIYRRGSGGLVTE